MAERVVYYAPLVTSHPGNLSAAVLLLMKNKDGTPSPREWMWPLGIPSAGTTSLPTLEHSEFSLAKEALLVSVPGSWRGLEKTVLKNPLTAQSPFGPNFRAGFFRAPTKVKGPRGRPCLCLHLPVQVRAILPATLSRARCAAAISYR